MRTDNGKKDSTPPASSQDDLPVELTEDEKAMLNNPLFDLVIALAALRSLIPTMGEPMRKKALSLIERIKATPMKNYTEAQRDGLTREARRLMAEALRDYGRSVGVTFRLKSENGEISLEMVDTEVEPIGEGGSGQPTGKTTTRTIGKISELRRYLFPQESLLAAALCNKAGFLKAPSGQFFNDMQKMNEKRAIINERDNKAVFSSGPSTMIMKGYDKITANMGLEQHKLLTMLAIAAIDTNSRHVSFSYKHYGDCCGVPNLLPHYGETAEEKKTRINATKAYAKKLNATLRSLRHAELTTTEKNKKDGGTKNYTNLSIIGTSGIRNGAVFAVIDDFFMQYIMERTLSWFDIRLLSIDSRHENAYRLANKLYYHFFQYRNQARETANCLKVETLLEATDLQTYDQVMASKTRSWQRRMKEPLENALEYLQNMGILNDWRYTGAKGAELSDEFFTGQDISFDTWYGLYIKFALADVQPVIDVIKPAVDAAAQAITTEKKRITRAKARAAVKKTTQRAKAKPKAKK